MNRFLQKRFFSYSLPWNTIQGPAGKFKILTPSETNTLRNGQLLSPPIQVKGEHTPSEKAIELATKILTSPEYFDKKQLTSLAKQKVIEEFKRHPIDTGSSEVQIACLSEQILRLQDHFREHPRDIHSRRGLMGLLQRRRKLLLYLEEKNPSQHKRIIEKYHIREGQGASRVTNRSEFWSPPRKNQVVSYRPETWKEFKKPAPKFQKAGHFEQKAREKEEELKKDKKKREALKNKEELERKQMLKKEKLDAENKQNENSG